jgi:hypothetical protein
MRAVGGTVKPPGALLLQVTSDLPNPAKYEVGCRAKVTEPFRGDFGKDQAAGSGGRACDCSLVRKLMFHISGKMA